MWCGGFTLIELLIVVAILAILAVVVVITLNPAQLIKQSRDSARMDNIGAINRVIGLYQADGGTFFGTSSIVYVSVPDPAATTTSGTNCSTMGLPALPSGWTYHCAASSTYRNINGLGWIPVNFTQISFGNPLPNLPVDPINTTSTGEYYTYATGESWELTTLIESDKYAEKAVDDGDSYPGVYSKRTSAVSFTPGTRDKGMVGYWTFDEGSGTNVYDSSGNGNNGTWSGTGAHYTAGKVGSYAGQFSGSTTQDWVDTIAQSYLGRKDASFTVIAWIKPSVVAGTVLHNTDVNSGWSTGLLGYYTGKLSFFIYNGSQTTSPNSGVADQWVFAGGVRQNSGNKNLLYENGSLVASSTGSYYTDPELPHKFTIGRFRADCCQMDSPGWFNGLIDDVRIYNRALSAAEISAIYNATK